MRIEGRSTKGRERKRKEEKGRERKRREEKGREGRERKRKAEEIRAICKGRRHKRKGKRKGCVVRRM
jgi:hypothetical protein